MDVLLLIVFISAMESLQAQLLLHYVFNNDNQ